MKTYKDWTAAGFQVKKGEKGKKRDGQGIALFSKTQVKPRSTYEQHDYADEDYEFDRDHGDVYFHDRDWW